MKSKRLIYAHGTVVLPLGIGKQAFYLQNGILKVTGRVERILEQTDDYVKFETRKYCYCIAGHIIEECALMAA